MSGILSNISSELLDEVMQMVGVELIIDRDRILHELTVSRDHQNAILIASRALGPQYYITAVEDIILGENGGEITVVIKPYDITGYIFPINKLLLSEIKAVSLFKSKLENPFMRVLQSGTAD